MKRNTWNFVIDVLTLVVFGGLAWIGFLIHYVLPPGHGQGGGGRGLLLWGWNRHDYGLVHFYLALGMLLLVMVHLWLHWAWVCGTVAVLLGRSKAQYRRRLIYGLIFLLLLTAGTAGTLIWANTQVETVAQEKGRRANENSEIHIERLGQRSLQEISRISSVPVERFITELKLPADVDTTEQLGRLRRWFRFEMEKVHQVIEEYSGDNNGS